MKSKPLSGAEDFSLKVIFKPEAASDPNYVEQRFVHIQNTVNENDRILTELKLTKDNNWFWIL